MFSNYQNHPKAEEDGVLQAIEAHQDSMIYLKHLMAYGSMDDNDVMAYLVDYKKAVNLDVQRSTMTAFKLFQKVNPLMDSYYYPNNNNLMPSANLFERYGNQTLHKNNAEMLNQATRIARLEAYLDYNMTVSADEVLNYDKEMAIEKIVWIVRDSTKEDVRVNYNPATTEDSVDMINAKYKYSRPPVIFSVGDNWYETVATKGIFKTEFKGRQAWVYEAKVFEEGELDTTYRVKFAQVYGTKEQKDLAFRHGYSNDSEYMKLFHKDEAYLVVDNTDSTVQACGTSLKRTQTTLRGRLMKKMMDNLQV